MFLTLAKEKFEISMLGLEPSNKPNIPSIVVALLVLKVAGKTTDPLACDP